jgi:hypothetical protein
MEIFEERDANNHRQLTLGIDSLYNRILRKTTPWEEMTTRLKETLTRTYGANYSAKRRDQNN